MLIERRYSLRHGRNGDWIQNEATIITLSNVAFFKPDVLLVGSCCQLLSRFLFSCLNPFYPSTAGMLFLSTVPECRITTVSMQFRFWAASCQSLIYSVTDTCRVYIKSQQMYSSFFSWWFYSWRLQRWWALSQLFYLFYCIYLFIGYVPVLN